VNFLRWLDHKFEEVLMMVALFLISVIMAYSVVMRYIFNDSLSWAEEICRYLFVWSAFLSASMCLKKRSSIKIDMLLLALPAKFQKVLLVAGDVVMFVFFAYMLNAAWGVSYGMYSSPFGQTSPALMLPMYLVFGASVVAFALCLLRLAERLYFLLTTPGAGYRAHLDAGKGGKA
jgi:TRAP-type C4-dicarboxylate transport system permease small subunit